MRATVAGCLSDVQVQAGELSATVEFPADLPVFAGHFPGRPLVPGVFLIEAVRSACERALGRRCVVTELREARFSREVLPASPVDLRATWREAGPGEYDCDARLSAGSEPVARVRLGLCVEAGAEGDECSASS